MRGSEITGIQTSKSGETTHLFSLQQAAIGEVSPISCTQKGRFICLFLKNSIFAPY